MERRGLRSYCSTVICVFRCRKRSQGRDAWARIEVAPHPLGFLRDDLKTKEFCLGWFKDLILNELV